MAMSIQVGDTHDIHKQIQCKLPNKLVGLQHCLFQLVTNFTSALSCTIVNATTGKVFVVQTYSTSSMQCNVRHHVAAARNAHHAQLQIMIHN
jgi:hypothetical protein